MSEFEKYVERQHVQYPSHTIIVSEYGAGSDLRLRSSKPKAFEFCMEYQQEYVEHYLPVIESTPYIVGASYWNFIDFSAANRNESMPRINNKGLVQSDRTPKDVYYYFRSMWRDDSPVPHIALRDFGGTMPATWVDTLPVKVYTNMPEVELLVNGVSLGRRKVENRNAIFPVRVKEGEMTFEARGKWQGTDVFDGVSISGTVVEECLSPQVGGSGFHALRKKYRVSTKPDCIDIRFSGITGTTFLSGIKIVPIE